MKVTENPDNIRKLILATKAMMDATDDKILAAVYISALTQSRELCIDEDGKAGIELLIEEMDEYLKINNFKKVADTFRNQTKLVVLRGDAKMVSEYLKSVCAGILLQTQEKKD